MEEAIRMGKTCKTSWNWGWRRCRGFQDFSSSSLNKSCTWSHCSHPWGLTHEFQDIYFKGDVPGSRSRCVCVGQAPDLRHLFWEALSHYLMLVCVAEAVLGCPHVSGSTASSFVVLSSWHLEFPVWPLSKFDTGPTCQIFSPSQTTPKKTPQPFFISGHVFRKVLVGLLPEMPPDTPGEDKQVGRDDRSISRFHDAATILCLQITQLHLGLFSLKTWAH